MQSATQKTQICIVFLLPISSQFEGGVAHCRGLLREAVCAEQMVKGNPLTLTLWRWVWLDIGQWYESTCTDQTHYLIVVGYGMLH